MRTLARRSIATGGDPVRPLPPPQAGARASSSCSATCRARWRPTPAPCCSSCTPPSARARRGGLRVRHAADAAHARAAVARPRQALARAAARGCGLGGGHAHRRVAEGLQRRLGPPRADPGRRRADRLRRLGAPGPGAGRRARCAGCTARPTRWCGSTRSRAARYEPLGGGMRAALPYVDRFVAGHNSPASTSSEAGGGHPPATRGLKARTPARARRVVCSPPLLDNRRGGGGGVQVHAPAMRELIDESAEVERIGTGFTFTEGPLWHPRGGTCCSATCPATCGAAGTSGRRRPRCQSVQQGQRHDLGQRRAASSCAST